MLLFVLLLQAGILNVVHANITASKCVDHNVGLPSVLIRDRGLMHDSADGTRFLSVKRSCCSARARRKYLCSGETLQHSAVSSRIQSC